MARIFTSGFETNTLGLTLMDGTVNVGAPTIATDIVRSGIYALNCDSGAGNASADVQVENTTTSVLNRHYYASAAFYVATGQLPTTTATIMRLIIATLAQGAYLKLTTTGTLQVWNTTSAQVGSDSAVVPLDTWFVVDLHALIQAGSGDDTIEARLNGVSFASSTTQTGGTTVSPVRVSVGWNSAPGANKVLRVDDVKINDDQGGSQNSWPGPGKIVLLRPTADSAVGTGWTLGTGTAISANGFDSVNNVAPVGVADLAVGSDPKQVRNAAAAANSNFDTTMTTYAAAGITSVTDEINVVLPVIATAAPVSTSAKQGTVGVVSNPAIANVALGAGGTSGAFWSGTAAGTFTTGWKFSIGTATYAPAITLTTAPVMRVTQVTSSTRIAMVCFMGIYVDFTPGPPLPNRPKLHHYPQLLAH